MTKAGVKKNETAEVVPTVSTAHQASAGQLLRQAREAAGMRLPSLAANLKVSASKLEALEADDWSALPDTVFARALAAAVCRSLKMDATVVLAKLPQATSQDLSKVGEGLNTKVSGNSAFAKGGDFSPQKPVVWIAVVVLLVIASLMVLLYPWLLERFGKRDGDAAAGITMQSNLLADTDAPASAAQGTSPAVVEAEVANVSSRGPVGASVQASQSTPDAVSAEPVLKIKASEDTWVQAKELSGAVVFEKVVKAGTEQEVTGTPPWSLVVGNPTGAEVFIRGKPFDLSKATKFNTARFEVK